MANYIFLNRDRLFFNVHKAGSQDNQETGLGIIVLSAKKTEAH
jgi:hypothetical protein